jgi:hypothetical protein
MTTVQFHALNTWSLAGSTILGGYGNFRRWGLAGGSRLLGSGPWGHLVLGPFLSLSLFPVCHRVSSYCHDVLPPWDPESESELSNCD